MICCNISDNCICLETEIIVDPYIDFYVYLQVQSVPSDPLAEGRGRSSDNTIKYSADFKGISKCCFRMFLEFATDQVEFEFMLTPMGFKPAPFRFCKQWCHTCSEPGAGQVDPGLLILAFIFSLEKKKIQRIKMQIKFNRLG